MSTFASCIAPSPRMATAAGQPSSFTLLATSLHIVSLVFSMISYIVSSLAKRLICFLFYKAWHTPLQLLLRLLGLYDHLRDFQDRQSCIGSHLGQPLHTVISDNVFQEVLACFCQFILFHSFLLFFRLI